MWSRPTTKPQEDGTPASRFTTLEIKNLKSGRKEAKVSAPIPCFFN